MGIEVYKDNPKQGWDNTRFVADGFMLRKYEEEYLTEMKGIALLTWLKCLYLDSFNIHYLPIIIGKVFQWGNGRCTSHLCIYYKLPLRMEYVISLRCPSISACTYINIPNVNSSKQSSPGRSCSLTSDTLRLQPHNKTE